MLHWYMCLIYFHLDKFYTGAQVKLPAKFAPFEPKSSSLQTDNHLITRTNVIGFNMMRHYALRHTKLREQNFKFQEPQAPFFWAHKEVPVKMLSVMNTATNKEYISDGVKE